MSVLSRVFKFGNECEAHSLLNTFGSLQVGDFLIPQPYCYAMRVDKIGESWYDGYRRIACTIFALTAERMPDLSVKRSAHDADSFYDVRPSIGEEWYRRHDGQRWQIDEAIPVYLKRVQLPGQMNLF